LRLLVNVETYGIAIDDPNVKVETTEMLPETKKLRNVPSPDPVKLPRMVADPAVNALSVDSAVEIKRLANVPNPDPVKLPIMTADPAITRLTAEIVEEATSPEVSVIVELNVAAL